MVGQLYGKKALPDEARIYKTKSKNAQEAHEAVRPTSAAVTPERLAGKIDVDLLKLYTLIWKRTVASQMAPAVYDTVAVDLLPAKASTVAPTARHWSPGSWPCTSKARTM